MAQDRTPPSAPVPPRSRQPKYWRWLLAPMLLASVGLHGLVLFAPTGPADEDLVPPPDPEEDGIAITKIEAPQPRSTAAVPANAGAVQAGRAPQAAPRAAAPASAAQNQRAAANTAPNAQRSSTSGQGRRPATTSSAASGATAANQSSVGPTVPDLGDVPSARNPNPTTPAVGGSGNDSDVAASTGPESTPFDEYIKVFETYNDVKLSEADAAEQRTIWLDSFRDRGPEFTDLEIQPLNDIDPLPYTANICLPSPPRAAQLLVMVNAQGEAEEYQPFLQRTGYRMFDNAAADKIASYDFPAADTPQAYLAEVPVDYDAENCEWPPTVDKLPDEYFAVLDNYIGPELTTPAEAKTAQENWLKSLSEADDLELSPTDEELVAQEFEAFEEEVPYPLEICLPLAPKDAEFGVVVQPDGSLGNEPQLLRSTGYQNFDDRAQALVEAFDFTGADTPQILVVEVPVDYNGVNCQPLDSESFDVPATLANASPNDEAETDRDAADAEPSSSNAAIALNPARQTQLIENGRAQVEAAAVGSLNTQLAIAAEFLQSGWPEDVNQSCFLADLTESNFVPVDAAADAIILSENADSAPLTLSRLYDVTVQDAEDYCGASLLQMTVAEAPQLFASIIPFGSGGASTLVVLWTANPHGD